MERKAGYYWVKCSGEWEIAEYSEGGLWYRHANENTFTDEYFDHICRTPIEMLLD